MTYIVMGYVVRVNNAWGKRSSAFDPMLCGQTQPHDCVECHNYIGHHCICHNYKGHNYVMQHKSTDVSGAHMRMRACVRAGGRAGMCTCVCALSPSQVQMHYDIQEHVHGRDGE